MEERCVFEIIGRYSIGNATAEEIAFLDAWFNTFDSNPSLTSTLTSDELSRLSSTMFERISNAIGSDTNLEK